MKISKWFLGVLLAISLMFAVGCSKDDKNKDNSGNSIVGTWKTQTMTDYEEGYRYYFELRFDNNGLVHYYEFYDEPGYWVEDYDGSYQYQLSGNTVTVYFDDYQEQFSYSGGNSFVYGGVTWTRK
jgi:major membrane immunogen (membrane-anchored lipoprotein)